MNIMLRSLLFLTLLIAMSSAVACSCLKEERDRLEAAIRSGDEQLQARYVFEKADVIVFGIVTRLEAIGPPGAHEYHSVVAAIEPIEFFKGDNQIRSLYSSADGSSCGSRFYVGKRFTYLATLDRNGRALTMMCLQDMVSNRIAVQTLAAHLRRLRDGSPNQSLQRGR